MGFGFWTFNQTNLSRSESAALIEAYYQSYPQLIHISSQIDFAETMAMYKPF
jgi:DNA polymerase-1